MAYTPTYQEWNDPDFEPPVINIDSKLLDSKMQDSGCEILFYEMTNRKVYPIQTFEWKTWTIIWTPEAGVTLKEETFKDQRIAQIVFDSAHLIEPCPAD